MKVLTMVLVLLAGPVQDLPKEKKPTPVEIQAKKESREEQKAMEESIAWLLDEDKELSELGRKRLIAFGKKAVPYLEKEIEKREATRIYEVLKLLSLSSIPEDDRWVDESIRREIEARLKAMSKKLPKEARAQSMYAWFLEAHTYAQKGNYERAHQMADSLLKLDPKSRYTNDLKAFRRYCDQRITQTSLIRAELILSQNHCASGEAVTLRLRMENVSPQQLQLRYAISKEGEAKFGTIVLPMEITYYYTDGSRREVNTHAQVTLGPDVPIATGAQWETELKLDTRSLFGTLSSEREIFARVNIAGWTQPSRIETTRFNLVKRIIFIPQELCIVPRNYTVLLADPLQELIRLMSREGQGTISEVFCAAMLLKGTDKDKGMHLLISEMEKSKTSLGHPVVGNILNQMTGEQLGEDPARWREWYKERRKPEEQQKK